MGANMYGNQQTQNNEPNNPQGIGSGKKKDRKDRDREKAMRNQAHQTKVDILFTNLTNFLSVPYIYF